MSTKLILLPFLTVNFIINPALMSSTSSSNCNISIRRPASNCSFNLRQYDIFGIVQRKSSNLKRLGIWARYSPQSRDSSSSDIEIFHPGRVQELDTAITKLLVPVPLLLQCGGLDQSVPTFVSSCEFIFGRPATTNYAVTSSIPIKNFTILNEESSALFLEEGSTTLKRCKITTCSTEYEMTAGSHLLINIMLPKHIGSECDSVDDCGPPDLYECKNHMCQCGHSSGVTSFVVDHHGRICVSNNRSEIEAIRCHNDPGKCRNWCNGTERIDCVCPFIGHKVRRLDGRFICELNEGSPCGTHKARFLNRILHCPPSTECIQNECKRSLSGRSNERIYDSNTGFVGSFGDHIILIKTFIVILCIILVFVFIALVLAMCKLRRRKSASQMSPLYPSMDQDSVLSKGFSPLEERISTNSSNTDFGHLANVRNFTFSTVDSRLNPHVQNPMGWLTPNPIGINLDNRINQNERRRRKGNSCTRSFKHQNPCPPWCMANDAVIAQLERTFIHNRRNGTARNSPHRNCDEGYVTDEVRLHNEQNSKADSPSCPIVKRLSNGDVTISA
ncbi:hypothetical protein ACOME3_003549 [Neoechinorhynchus agilis]